MKITITGSLGNVAKPLTKQLISAGHQVTVISHTDARRADIEALGAKAAIGSVSDVAFLKNAFAGADAVFAMVPPTMGGGNIVVNTGLAGEAIANAIKASGVKRVVMLSSIGADLPEGNGPIAGLYKVEHHFQELKDVNITFLRAGYFYTNFYNDVPMIKGMNMMGGNFASDTLLPLVHPEDIAAAAAQELQGHSTGKTVRYIVSDLKMPAEVANGIGAAIGKPELPWVEFSDEDALKGMKQAGLPEEMAGLYTEMGRGFRNGSIPKHYNDSGKPVQGTIKLEAFAKAFAVQFSGVGVA